MLLSDDGSSADERSGGQGMEVTGRLHILRHTFFSSLAMRGSTAKSIQELAGHVSLATTQRYMHVSPAANEGAIRLLDGPPAPERRAI